MKVICTPNTQRLPHWEAFFFYTTRRKPLEVKINKEIQSYSESMFFGLSMRQCGFSLAAMLVAVGLYFLLSPMWVRKPSAGCVFWEPHPLRLWDS